MLTDGNKIKCIKENCSKQSKTYNVNTIPLKTARPRSAIIYRCETLTLTKF